MGRSHKKRKQAKKRRLEALGELVAEQRADMQQTRKQQSGGRKSPTGKPA